MSDQPVTPPRSSATPADPATVSNRGMVRATWGVSAITLMSRALGLARDYLLVQFLGPCRWVLDAFLLAFTIPNLFRRLFGEGALTAAFLPVFVRSHREDAGTASSLASAVFSLLFLVLAAVAVVGMLGCLLAGSLLAPARPLRLTLQLLAVMLPFLCLVCCSALLTAMLQALRCFALPAAMSVVLNLCLLGGLGYAYYYIAGGDARSLQSSPLAVRAAFALAAAVLVAGGLQLLLQWPALRARGVRIVPSLAFGQEGVRRTLRAFGPTALGLGVVQVNVLVDNLLAGALSFGPGQAAGAVQYLYLGNRLMQLPLGVFGIALATTAFPFLSTHAAEENHGALFASLRDAIRLLVFVVLPAAIGLGIMGDPLVRLIFQKPDLAFGDAAVYRTASVLACYAGGLVFFSLQHLLTRVFYARGEYGTPVKVAAAMVGVNLVLNLLLVHAPDLYLRWSHTTIARLGRLPLLTRPGATPVLGEAGLALATSITALCNVLILWHCLKARLQPRVGAGRWEREVRSLHWSLLRMAVAAGLMGLFVFFTRNSIPYEPELLALLERGLAPMVLGVLCYWVACMVLPVPEFDEFVWRRGQSGGQSGQG